MLAYFLNLGKNAHRLTLYFDVKLHISWTHIYIYIYIQRQNSDLMLHHGLMSGQHINNFYPCDL